MMPLERTHPTLAQFRTIVAFGGLIAAGAGIALGCASPSRSTPVVLADDIPVAHTPDGGWRGEMPAPILASCTEPLAEGAPDLRGTWRAISVERDGQALPDHPLATHVERIEQCGNRLIVVGPRFIHDFRTTGRLADGANDISPRGCSRVRAAIEWNDEKTLEFRAWGIVKVVTRRREDQDTLIWEYPGQETSRLKRICRLPPPGSA